MLKLICDALLLKSDWHVVLEGSCVAVPVCPSNSAAPLFTESTVGSPNTWLFLKKSAIAWNSDVRSWSEVDGNSPAEIGMFATNCIILKFVTTPWILKSSSRTRTLWTSYYLHKLQLLKMPQIAFNSQSSNSCPQHGHVPQNKISTVIILQQCNLATHSALLIREFQISSIQYLRQLLCELWHHPQTEKKQLVHTRYSNPTWKMQTGINPNLVFLTHWVLKIWRAWSSLQSNICQHLGLWVPQSPLCLQLWWRLPPQWFPYLMWWCFKRHKP